MQRQSYKEDAAYVTCVSCVIHTPPPLHTHLHKRDNALQLLQQPPAQLQLLSQKHLPLPPLIPPDRFSPLLSVKRDRASGTGAFIRLLSN